MRKWDRAISEMMPAVEFTHVESDGYEACYHKWSLTICDGCFDTLKSSKMRS